MDEMVKRALIAHPELNQPNPTPSIPSTSHSRTLSPNLVSLLGAGADGVSTYNFLAHPRGITKEDNPLLSGGSPFTAGLGAAGMGLGNMALAALIKKKWPSLAETLQAPIAARQLAVGLSNFTDTPNSNDLVSNAMSGEAKQGIARNLK